MINTLGSFVFFQQINLLSRRWLPFRTSDCNEVDFVSSRLGPACLFPLHFYPNPSNLICNPSIWHSNINLLTI